MQSNETIILTIVISTIIAFVLSTFVVYMLFNYGRKQTSLKSNFEKELLQAQLEIQEQTFRHISQELHDNVIQFLNLAKLHLTSTEYSKNETITLIENCSEEMQHLSRSLNAEYIIENGLLDIIEKYVVQLKKVRHFFISFTVTGDPQYLKDNTEIMLFRIIQEAINNIIKHSRATTIILSLCYEKDHLKCIIEDDGVGFNVNEKLNKGYANGSTGLQNIIRRAKMINASYEINSINQKGTILCIKIPY